MPTKKTVTVNFDGADTLTLNPPLVELESGDWVQWDFQNAPSGSLPIIVFDSPFGPFQCLQSIANQKVQGKGNVGENGEGTLYNYQAFLLNDTDALATSGTSSVRNLPQPKNTSPVFEVEVKVVEDSGGERHYSLEFESEALKLFPGDTAFWDVFDLPAGNFISFLFTSGPPDLDPLVGPFDSLVANRAVSGEETGVMRVIGTNFTPKASRYTYQIAVRDASGMRLASEDPVIDNLGDPGPPTP